MSSLSLPVYATKPQRRIPETDGCIAVTMYASGDRSVRHYSLFSVDGEHLGSVSSHTRRAFRSGGYHEGHRPYDHRLRTWPNLADAARDLLKEKSR